MQAQGADAMGMRDIVISPEWTQFERELLIDLLNRDISGLEQLEATLALDVTFPPVIRKRFIDRLRSDLNLMVNLVTNESAASLELNRSFFEPILQKLKRKLKVTADWNEQERTAVAALLLDHQFELMEQDKRWHETILWNAPCYAENQWKIDNISVLLKALANSTAVELEELREKFSDYVL